MATTFAECVSIYNAEDTDGILAGVPLDALFGYAIITDHNGSWILTTEACADDLDINELPYADHVYNIYGEYSAFWESIAESVEVIGDCNNPIGAARAICAREGVEMIGD